ncbi:MAG: hypothetical protein KatS3mg131_3928 [Candidatus Tectimicrobiota bacterium]|nr:MAG: hypothetical protein KatS3mg131_3928 [Candidatus Tectomicrobia bacterium]
MTASAARARQGFWSLTGGGVLLLAGVGVAWALRRPQPLSMLELCWAMMRRLWGEPPPAALSLADVPLLVVAASSLWATAVLLWAWGRGRCLLRRSQPYRPGAWPALDAALSGLPWQPPQLRLLAVPSPLACTLGLWRPRLLLSTGLLRQLSAAEVRAMLGHEWGHVRHGDVLRLAVLRWWRAALWFLPAVHALAQACQRAIEEAADDAAVALTGAPLDLAAALVKTAKARAVPAWSPALAGEAALPQRIERLLAPAATRPRRVRFWPWGVSLAVVAGLLALLFVPHPPPAWGQPMLLCPMR